MTPLFEKVILNYRSLHDILFMSTGKMLAANIDEDMVKVDDG